MTKHAIFSALLLVLICCVSAFTSMQNVGQPKPTPDIHLINPLIVTQLQRRQYGTMEYSRQYRASMERRSTPPTTKGGDVSEDSSETPKKFVLSKWTDFVHGAEIIHSNYLELFWEYNFRKNFPWLLPVLIVLTLSRLVSPNVGDFVFDALKNSCNAAFGLTSVIGGVLQLPFDTLRWLIASAPAIAIPFLDHLPSNIAIHLVRILLFLQHEAKALGQTTIVTGLTVIFWRPMVEEIQYRYLLNKLFRKGRKKPIINGEAKTDDEQNKEHSSIVKFIPVEGSESESEKKTPSLEQKPPTLRNPSWRILISCVVFACTRLGWLSSHADNSINLPFGMWQTAASPYSWTVGFIQSAIAHFSTRVLSELSPFLQRGLLLLALQQTISTFLVTWFVFAPLYQQRGLTASIGAHVAWTVGKMTWPIRLLWRISPSLQHILPSSVHYFFERKR